MTAKRSEINKISENKLVEIYRTMSLIRKVQTRIEELYHLDEMKTPVHLCLGQEAIPTGVCLNLKKGDYISSNHRGHGHYLAKGGDLKALIAELYCKETGCSRGRGGSMHLVDTKVGHMGSSAIVGGGIPIGVGTAFGSTMKKDKKISAVFFGDAASEEGVLYESMNFAALKKLPVLFVCENNFYSVCSHINAREANSNIHIRSKVFNIPSFQVDGTDVIEVYLKTKEAVKHIRSGKGPFFIEARAYRWTGHSGQGDNMKNKYRKMDEWKKWINIDPVKKLEKNLKNNEKLTGKRKNQINDKIDKQIDAAFKYAQKSPLPDKRELTKYLYGE